MKTIRLAPTKHAAPVCDAYHDETELRRFEHAVRVHRAHSERFQIAMLDERVDGAYRVTGTSGASYFVDVVDRSGLHDACSCLDFLTNDLGTCKHLEAVRRAIQRVPALEQAFRKLRERPRQAVLTLRAAGEAGLCAVGPWPDGALERLGMRLAPELGAECVVPQSGAHEGLSADGGERRVRIVRAAPIAAERIRRRLAAETRRASLTQAIAQGALSLDVLTVPLFPYQREGAAHLLRAGRALLADDMGLGKTAQAIAACELLRARGEATRVLIVTLASLKHQWAREIARFAGVPAVVVGGSAVDRRHALESDAPYKILNYELTWRELSSLKSLDADVVVYDEAQRAKNFRTKTARTIREIPSRFVFVLTGTPIENRLDDLYALAQIVDPSVFGPLWRFNLQFHQQTENGKVVGYKNLAELRQRIAPLVLRRRKEEVLTQLPSLTEQTRYTALSPAQRELESGYRQQAGQLMALAARRGLTKHQQDRLMMYLVKARQACSAAELCDPKRKGSPKLDEFQALLTEIVEQGTAKVLVFSEWVEMLKLAALRLDEAGIGHTMLHGGVPSDKRAALLDRFRESDDVRVLLSSEAGGVGLNLQVASYVVHLDLPWNPARLDQRTARAHRMGQTRGVSAIYLCAEEGIERAIERTLAGKRAVRSAALDGESSVETLEAPSFMLFLREMQDLFDDLAAPGEDVEVEETANDEAVNDDSPPTPAFSAAVPATSSEATTPALAASLAAAAPLAARQRGEAYARSRLSLAQVVLDAGFPGDAVKAAYEALAAAITSLLPEPPSDHATLVAAIFRELVPHGRLPAAAHGTLARLRDLVSLAEHGVGVTSEFADAALREAREWTERVTTAPGDN